MALRLSLDHARQDTVNPLKLARLVMIARSTYMIDLLTRTLPIPGMDGPRGIDAGGTIVLSPFSDAATRAAELLQLDGGTRTVTKPARNKARLN